ncbi:XRE family transcriptional regulator [Wenjunlia vitaminophila]|uniref:XRE family transcriptional regulator n=1 Tax=Wenjunlia vitaminophila TaxID=76728 RepID=A0A0T6LMV1_WENVI|nr:helix-turn-helix transcriptional regulator [Wenjunlia vitaminophila]KRV47418.1 XRE family transcriptional regulator [Wenjunlia vitaminophila]
MSAWQPSRSSTVRRIMLGSQLRRLRESHGITREAAGYFIRASESKISRMELGRVSFKERDVSDLLTLYGVTDETERAALLRLARDASSAGWWHSYADVLPVWFQTYVGLEEATSQIRTYELQYVPGLLQCEEYARAVVSLGQPTAPEQEVERRVALRMKRQELLVCEGAPRYLAVLDEAALRRPFGGVEVMRAQFARLLELAERPNVTIQVMPFAFGGHAGESGAFTILGFAEPDLPDVVYLEQLTGALYLDKPEEVGQYARAMDRLVADSEPPERSVALLRTMLERT